MNWISTKERLPDKGGKYLTACRGYSKENIYYYIAWWEPEISEVYPFKYREDYEGRAGGGWVINDSEGDWELRGVEWWCEIESPVEEKDK